MSKLLLSTVILFSAFFYTVPPLPLVTSAVTEMLNEEKLPMTIEGRSRNNKSASVTGSQYTVSPVNAGIFVTDSNASYFVPNDGFVGNVTISVTGDNKLGDEVRGTLAVTVSEPPAVRIVITPGTPVLK